MITNILLQSIEAAGSDEDCDEDYDVSVQLLYGQPTRL